MTSRNAYRLKNESANPACAPAQDILVAGASQARAASPAARPSHDVVVAAGGGITLARNTPRQLTNRHAVLVGHDTPEQKLRLALGIQAFTPASARSKGECGRITITHIYRK
jgi:hypothetical protein